MTTNNPLSERIFLHYHSLTDSYRKIADYLQLNPEKILMLSTAQIADTCGVSKASVSRFIRKLGYEDHTELRNLMLDERDKGQPVIVSCEGESELNYEIQALEKLFAQFASKDNQGLTETLANAKRVKIIGYRNSYPLAMHFRQQLMQCRDGVDLLPLPGQTIGEDLASIDQDDFVVVIGIRRRTANFEQIIRYLSKFDTLLITDQSGQKYSQLMNYVFICYMNNELPLDSYAAPMSLISHLVNQTFLHLKSHASSVSSQISTTYNQLGELE
jgi:DNA-binding MurR/RpiR family transcriptional regulator